MDIKNSEIIFYILLSLFSVYIILQIYMVLKLKKIVQRLIEILFRLDNFMSRLRQGRNPSVTAPPVQSCQNCKNRIPFYLNLPDVHDCFYYRCQLTKRHVPSDHFCDHFVLDPQMNNVR